MSDYPYDSSHADHGATEEYMNYIFNKARLDYQSRHECQSHCYYQTSHKADY